jgi:hypothetical protein
MIETDDLGTEVLTIEEAAAVLCISRNAAYALAREWRATDGRRGLPCVQLGRCLRVPVTALRQMLDDASRGTCAGRVA